MKESKNETDRQNFQSIYGALFFGVPNQGMDTTDIASIVGDLPARYTLNLLDDKLGFRLRQRSHQEFINAFDFKDSKIISFIELETSPTIQKVRNLSQWLFRTNKLCQGEATQKWMYTGPRKLLVGPSSAAYGRPWEAGDDYIISLHVNHYNMVKLSPYDREVYPKARVILQDFVGSAVSVIEARTRGLSPSTMFRAGA